MKQNGFKSISAPIDLPYYIIYSGNGGATCLIRRGRKFSPKYLTEKWIGDNCKNPNGAKYKVVEVDDNIENN